MFDKRKYQPEYVISVIHLVKHKYLELGSVKKIADDIKPKVQPRSWARNLIASEYKSEDIISAIHLISHNYLDVTDIEEDQQKMIAKDIKEKFQDHKHTPEDFCTAVPLINHNYIDMKDIIGLVISLTTQGLSLIHVAIFL